MNRVTGIIVAGVMVLLMVGCGGRRYPQALLVADSLMNSRPDSALAVLEGVEGQMADTYQRHKWQLLRLNTCNKLDTVFTITHASQAKELTDYFDRHGTANEQMLAYYLLGRTYADAGEAPQAINAYNEAAEHADTAALDCLSGWVCINYVGHSV